MKRLGAPLLSLLLTTVLVGPAHAGGWWSNIGLDGQPLGMGESISLRVSEVMFDSIEEAEEAKNVAFFAYLVRDFDQAALDEAMNRANPGDWWEPRSDPVRVGTVELIKWDGNLAKARVRLDVPQIADGSYYLMLCDLGCKVALGSVIPSRVSVTRDVLVAQTTRRLEQTEANLTMAVQRSRSELRETRRTLRQTLSDDARQADAIQALERQLADARRPEPSPWIAYAGWFFAGAAVMLVLARGRHRSRSDLDSMIEGIPDDPRELTRTP